MKPLVTVAIPARNSAKTLLRAVDSVLSQEYDSLEVIVAVNGCSDDTLSIAKSINDRRVTVLQSLPGIVPALNSCLKNSSGKYIARQDADDEWLPGKLQKQIDFLENSDVDVLGTQMKIRENSSETITEYPLSHEDCVKWLFAGRNPIGHPSVVFRTQLLEKVGGYWEMFPFAEDMDLWMRLLPHAKFANLDEPLNVYNHVHNVNYNPAVPTFLSRFYSTIYGVSR